MFQISSGRPERTQECILTAPLGIPRLVSVLGDAREPVRNGKHDNFPFPYVLLFRGFQLTAALHFYRSTAPPHCVDTCLGRVPKTRRFRKCV